MLTPTGHAETGKWNGTRQPGAQFTDQQIAEMARRGGQSVRWEVRKVTLKKPRERTAADIACCRPLEDCYDLVEVDCPIVTRGSKSDFVIAPGGDLVPVKAK